MSETPMDSHSDAHSRRRAARNQHVKNSRVVTYLAILFAAAFLLLLMSYFMQQRANEQAISGLTESLTSIHSLQNLVETNEQLEAELEEKTARAEELEKQSEALAAQVDALTEQQAKTVRAMDLFWQIDEAYVRGRYGLCRDLIQAVEDGGLKSHLPAESTTDTDRYSPADRYQEIYDALY